MFNDLAVRIKQGRGTAGMLLRDDALAERLRQTVNTTSSDIQEIVADMKAGRGPTGMLLRDEALAGQIRDTVKNARQATADLGHASRQVDSLVTDLNARRLAAKAGDLMDSLNNSVRQVNDIIA